MEPLVSILVLILVAALVLYLAHLVLALLPGDRQITRVLYVVVVAIVVVWVISMLLPLPRLRP